MVVSTFDGLSRKVFLEGDVSSTWDPTGNNIVEGGRNFKKYSLIGEHGYHH